MHSTAHRHLKCENSESSQKPAIIVLEISSIRFRNTKFFDQSVLIVYSRCFKDHRYTAPRCKIAFRFKKIAAEKTIKFQVKQTALQNFWKLHLVLKVQKHEAPYLSYISSLKYLLESV